MNFQEYYDKFSRNPVDYTEECVTMNVVEQNFKRGDWRFASYLVLDA